MGVAVWIKSALRVLRPMPFVAPTKTAVGFGVLVRREALFSVMTFRATILNWLFRLGL